MQIFIFNLLEPKQGIFVSQPLFVRQDENDYHIYLPWLAAPIATMSGWATVFYCAIFSYEMLERRFTKLKTINPILIGLLIGCIATFRDLNVDPVSTNIALWTWHELLPGWFFNVPLINFSAWMCAVSVYGMTYTYIQRREWHENVKIIALFAAIPVLLIVSAVLNFGFVGRVEGFDGPSWTARALGRS